MAEQKVDIGAMISTARQGARKALAAVAENVAKYEQHVADLKKERVATAKEAVKVLDTAEVANILGLSSSAVSAMIRDPEAPKRRRVTVPAEKAGESIGDIDVTLPDNYEEGSLPETDLFDALPAEGK